MKQLLIFVVLILVLLSSGVQAEVPNTISYQGIIATSGGEIVPDENYYLTFRLYNVQSGGTQLWKEDHNNVPVFQGRFNVILGSLANLASIPFDEPYWLGITVEPPSTELPRIELTSSAYSMNARSVMDDVVTSAKIQDGSISDADISNSANISASKINDGAGSGLDADLLDGQQASAFLSSGQANSVTSGMITNGTIQFADIGQNTAGSGQVMKWNGSAWDAANDEEGDGTSDHGALTGRSDDDHQQYLLVSRSSFISEFTGRLDIRQSGSQSLMDFRDNGGSRVGMIKIVNGDNLQLVSDDASLYISSGLDIVCANQAGTGTIPIYASTFNVSSTRAIKTDIRHLTERDCQQALADISGLRPATYQLKEATSNKTHLGLIAEEVPSKLLAPRGDAVDLYALVTSLVAAVKALEAQVELQSETIKELRGQ